MPKIQLYLHYACLSILVYLVIFIKLDAYHLRWWDESMFAVNTYEMLQNGNYFSMYFNGIPDISNSKPLLTVWIQCLFVKALGYNELALRLPSAISAALTVFLLFSFVNKRFGLTFAWLSALVLLTSNAFIGFHAARSGDSDALICLFLFIANTYFFRYLETGRNALIFYFFVFISLSFCTKLYAALLFVPAYTWILLQQHKLKNVVLTFSFWIGALLLCFSAFFIVYLRELGSPGYLREVFLKDAGRIFRVVEGHKHTWEFYLDNLIFTRFSFWFFLMLIGAALGFLNRTQEKGSFVSNFLLLVISYLFVISFSITKLEWYDIPLFPYLSVIAAYAIWEILSIKINLTIFNRSTLLLILVIFAYPYWLMFRKSQANTIPNDEKKLEANERFLFLKSNEKSKLSGTKIYTSRWIGSLLFYQYKFRENGDTVFVVETPDFKINDKVLVSEDSLVSIITSKYKVTLLEKENNAMLLRLDEVLAEQ